MNTTICFFAARRYWPEEARLRESFARLQEVLGSTTQDCRLIIDGNGIEKLHPADGDTLVVVPMSGAVQQDILRAAARFSALIVYAGYVKGNFDSALTAQMLAANAAPTVMDVWAVLRRTHARVLLATNPDQLAKSLRVLDTCDFLRRAKLLLVGETEPWVISSSRELNVYTERLDVAVEQVTQRELADLYAVATDADAAELYASYRNGAGEIREPNDVDLRASCRMAFAVLQLLKNHQADGAAFACFDLLKTGTTACLGVSHINGRTPMVAACEGDLDSACTMLLMKKLACTRLWMANPAIEPDGNILFSHCTAPVDVMGDAPSPYILRSHHESGIGVGLQVALPIGATVTACRLSDDAKKITIHKGVTVAHAYEPCCRTQLCVRFDDPARYLQTALGCHQVFAFEDITSELKTLATLLHLEICAAPCA